MITTHQPVTVWFGPKAFHKYEERGGNVAAFSICAVQKHLYSQAEWFNKTGTHYTSDHCPVLTAGSRSFLLGSDECLFVNANVKWW